MKENHHHRPKNVETSAKSLKVQVVKAVDLKRIDGPDGLCDPEVLMNVRMISGELSSPYQSSNLTDDCPGTRSFLLDVLDDEVAKLEVTLWNGVALSDNFLGQVVVNVSKLKPFAGIQVHQAFNIRAGGTMPTHGSGMFEPSRLGCLMFEPSRATDITGEDITGKLTLILEYITSKSIETTAKGFSLFVDKHWDTIKMQKAVFERDVSNRCITLLDSDASRIEFVGIGNLL